MCLLFIGVHTAQAQAPTISLGKTEIGPGQSFTITLTSKDDFTQPPIFPEIAGMPRQGSSSSSSTTIINGQINSTYSITQRYLAKSEGKFTLPKFSIAVNGKAFTHPSVTITVKKGANEDPDPSTVYDPYEDSFGSRRASSYKSVKENAFLGVDADKEQVWVGEGFTLTLSLYVAEDNRADMDFYNLSEQITEITKKIRPDNCWEESFDITNIAPRPVKINGKPYMEYRIWQSAFYPLDAKPLNIPRISLRMIKYESAIDPFFSGLDRKQTFTTFTSKPVAIQVREVPPNRYGRVLPVGVFTLDERIGRGKVETGQSVSYQFIVRGEGNIAAVEFPVPSATPALDVYPPTVQQNILRDGGHVTGIKTFTYLLQPKKEGKYPLAQQGFVFPFFNSKTGQNDSLTSQITLTSIGAAQESQEQAQDDGDYLSNTLIYLDKGEGMKVLGNMVLLVLGAGLAIGLIWKGKRA